MPFETEINPEEMGLGELGDMNQFYKSQLPGMVEGAKAKGGVGANRADDKAREYSQKQTSIESEIFGRLMDIHQDRSRKARIADESKKAKTTDDPEKWANNPGQYDWPGIDTPR